MRHDVESIRDHSVTHIHNNNNRLTMYDDDDELMLNVLRCHLTY